MLKFRESRYPWRQSRGWIWWLFWSACILSVGLVPYVAFQLARGRHRVTPPSDATSLEVFRQQMPPPRTLAIVAQEDKRYILWYGEKTDTLASGPALYVFDSSGRFLAWTPDSGDASLKPVEFARLQYLEVEKKLSLEEALRWVRPGHRL